MYVLLFAKLLLIIGAFAYSYSKIFDKDLFSFNQTFANTLSVLILGSVIYHVLQRDYYLPFLGPTVIPISDSKNEKSGQLVEVSLSDMPPNTKVLFWAANKSDATWPNPFDAYRGYNNSGLAKTNDQGNVTIKVNCPSDYNVSKFGFDKNLAKHVHYRYEFPKYPGMFSSVKTKYINC
jgi:hypothetical protein